MRMIAVYSPKGGVGKTSLAVNLAWASAALSSRRTLLWDLDAQGAASFILAGDDHRPDRAPDLARAVLAREIEPGPAIIRTAIDGLDLLPADASLRALDLVFSEIDAKKRLRRIGGTLERSYDRVVIDCPPGLGGTAEQVIRAAALILMPAIPSALAMRAADELRAHLDARRRGAPPVMPVFNLVDRRRAAHRAALAAAPAQAVIPTASLIEQMADRHAPLGRYAPDVPAARAIRDLWVAIERTLAADAGR